MCGIIGYSGDNNATEVLINGLSSLEYRGYDSAGIALFEEGRLRVIKAQGKVENVRQRAMACGKINSYCGIGHTRWATHGEPSDVNSHPHGNARIQIVHNGIIENYRSLAQELKEDGYTFKSSTDTEVCAMLIDKCYKKMRDPKKAILRAVSRLKGSFALGIIFCDYPNTIYSIKLSSPLVVGVSDNESFISSDITALLPYTRKYYLPPDLVLTQIKGGDVSFFDENGVKISLELKEAGWDASEAKRQGYAHFMLKEIHEQAEAIKKTLSPRISEGLPCFEPEGLNQERLRHAKRIFLVGCGTAYHACLMGKHFIEKYTKIPTRVEIASEFRYDEMPLFSEDVVIAVSQSGETADTLSAVRRAKAVGAYTIGVVNVVASTIALECETVIYTLAGPEIAVASTKAYTIQASLLALFAISLGLYMGKISDTGAREMIVALTSELPDAIDKILADEEQIALIAKRIHQRPNLFFIGRGVDYYACLEASLKLKEISYIHSEAYPAGELKHGTISLIEQGVPVVALSTVSRLADKMDSNIREVSSRGAFVIRVTGSPLSDHLASPSDSDDGISSRIGEPSDSSISYFLPPLREELYPIACATFFQLLAYYTATERNCDVDHPRNLAKSVTVE